MSAFLSGDRPNRATNFTTRRRRRSHLWTKMQSLDIALYFMAAFAALAWGFAVMGFPISAVLTAALIPVVFPEASLLLYCKAEVTWNRSGMGRSLPFSGAVSIVGLAVLTLTLTFSHADTANAQFLKGAEEYIKTKLAGGAAGAAKAVEIIFAVLRGLFLIYLGISIVRIVQSARNDQDWQDLARTPFIILIAVILGDILTGFIIGTAA
jgi:hypothetical protein